MSTEASTNLIEVRDLNLTLAKRRVLNIESVVIRRGEIIMLAGNNGSGKTTLLKIIAGLIRAPEAHFRCLGSPMNGEQAAAFCRGRHVYLHQTPYMFDGSVEDNVAYGLKQRGRDFAQRRIEIRDALAWAELEHLVHRHAHELSTGEKQWVALTRARILAPSLLLLDEITANMDSISRRRTYEMVADFKRAGSTVVFATHDHEPLEAIADVRLELSKGKLAPTDRRAAAVIPLRRDSSIHES